MCIGLGIIVWQDGQLEFTHPDRHLDISHNSILKGSKRVAKDTHTHIRNFIRVEIDSWTEKTFNFDEEASLPAWADEDEIKEKCLKLLARLKPLVEEYSTNMKPAHFNYETTPLNERICKQLYFWTKNPIDTWFENKWRKLQDKRMVKFYRKNDPAYFVMIEKMSKIDGYIPSSSLF